MKPNTSIIRTACIARLLPVLLLLSVLAVKADQYGDFTYSTDGTSVTISGYTGSGGDVTVPDTINDLPVTSIGGWVFWNCSSLTNVTIGTNVTSIGYATFAYCSGLTSVTIPASVANIGDYAFYFCTRLTGVYFQGNAPSLGGSYVFYIAIYPDRSNYSATLYYLPGTTGWGPWFGLSRALLLIPPYACQVFDDAVVISEYIGSGGAVTIPDTINGLPVNSIADTAFSQCTSITAVTIPNSVTNLGIQSFWNCSSLTNVTIGNGVTRIANNAFYDCISLTSVTIPNSVASIGNYAFYDCSSLINVTIPNSVTSIGMYAFSQCTSLATVTIGNGVTNIGQWAFSYCTNLTGVYFQGNAPSVGSSVFGVKMGSKSKVTVYYLPGTTGWGPTFVLRPTLLWTPQVQTSDGSFGVQMDGFGFNINWASGQTVVVEACTDLANPNWQPVQTNTLTTGSAYFSDTQWTNYPGRFYRLRSP
jgi:hypothetical protein